MITSNERKALEAIVKSEYQDGREMEHVVGHDVWTSVVNPFANKRTQSGVYASLTKKGFVKSYPDDGPNTATVHITQAGWDALHG